MRVDAIPPLLMDIMSSWLVSTAETKMSSCKYKEERKKKKNEEEKIPSNINTDFCRIFPHLSNACISFLLCSLCNL